MVRHGKGRGQGRLVENLFFFPGREDFIPKEMGSRGRSCVRVGIWRKAAEKYSQSQERNGLLAVRKRSFRSDMMVFEVVKPQDSARRPLTTLNTHSPTTGF